MSLQSDAFEKTVAKHVNKVPFLKAVRPTASPQYSDVMVTDKRTNVTTWIEVKMNHTDNLGNPRVFYDGQQWRTTYQSALAQFAVHILNRSTEAKAFVENLSDFSGINRPKIPTTVGGLKDPAAVPKDVMNRFFSLPGMSNRYITSVYNVDVGTLVVDHYTKAKRTPAYYLQASDDFYQLGRKNPLKVPSDVPQFKGKGSVRIRVSNHPTHYSVQAEIKVNSMPKSTYSLFLDSPKKNPFIVPERIPDIRRYL